MAAQAYLRKYERLQMPSDKWKAVTGVPADQLSLLLGGSS